MPKQNRKNNSRQVSESQTHIAQGRTYHETIAGTKNNKTQVAHNASEAAKHIKRCLARRGHLSHLFPTKFYFNCHSQAHSTCLSTTFHISSPISTNPTLNLLLTSSTT